MEQRKLGSVGPTVSAIGLGCNNFGYVDLPAARAVVHKALDLGVTFFDTADVYGYGASETYLGQILGPRRTEVLIATKFGVGRPSPDPSYIGASKEYVFEAVEASLKRLGTDYIDLYQSHFPDWRTPLEETLEALAELVEQGKIRHFGLCNYQGWQAADFSWIARTAGIPAPISMQNEYNLLARECDASVLPAAQHFGLGFLPWSPLANGLLTGKYKAGKPMPSETRLAQPRFKITNDRTLTERNWTILEALEKFAAARGCTLLELAYGWLMSRAAISSIIAGATRPEQVEANVAAAAYELSVEDVMELDKLTNLREPLIQQAPITLTVS